LLPFYTRYLTPADYGIMELLDLTASVVAMLVGLHMGDAFLYYYSAAATEEAKERVLTTAFVGSAVAAGILAVPVVVLAPKLSALAFQTEAYAFYLQLTFFGLIFLFPMEVLLAYLRLYNRSGPLLRVYVIRFVISVAVNVVLLAGFGLGVASMLWSVIAGNVFLLVSMGYMALPRRRWSWDGALFGRIFRYALPLGFSGLAMLSINFGDRFFLQRTVTVADIGIYALAYKIGMLVGQLQTVFNMSWTSQMFVVLRQPDGDRTYARIATYYFLCLAVAATLVAAFAYPLLWLLAAPAYIEAARFVPWVAIAYVVKPAGEFLRSVILVEKKPGIDTRISYIGAGVGFVGYIVWIPRYRLYGALAATIVAFGVMAVISLWEAQRIRSVRFEWRRWVLIGLAMSSALAVTRLGGGGGIASRTVFGVAGLIAFMAVLAFSGFFTRGELKAFRDKVGAIANRGRSGALERWEQ
jgi:O-antigen/teichoic acid export membrane protein